MAVSFSGIGTHHNHDHWMRDVQDRQRNLAFPDTVQNEARLWRNLQNIPWKTSTRIGMAILGIFVGAWLITLLFFVLHGGVWVVLAFASGMLFVFGSMFAVVAWATRSNLRSIEKDRHDRRNHIR